MRAIARYGSTAGMSDVTFDVTAYINDIAFDSSSAFRSTCSIFDAPTQG